MGLVCWQALAFCSGELLQPETPSMSISIGHRIGSTTRLWRNRPYRHHVEHMRGIYECGYGQIGGDSDHVSKALLQPSQFCEAALSI
jgi:hypothetical protein